MFTDIVGYSAMAFENERLAMDLVQEHRDLIRKLLPHFGGVERQTSGDGFFLEFGSAVEAVRCAIELQTMLHERHRQTPVDRQLKVRIGIHLGDIVSSETDLFGNGVNVAARIEPLATPGGIAISRQIFDQVDGKIQHTAFRKIGARDLKNIKSGAEIYRVVLPWELRPNRAPGFSFREAYRNFSMSGRWNGLALGGTTVVLTAIFLVALARGLSLGIEQMGAGRGAEKHALGLDWEYLLPEKDASTWRKFNPDATWETAGKIEGAYWLRHDFALEPGKFKEPTMVLGLVSDSHRVFINGHFVGGSNLRADLALYPFDPSLLKTEGTNQVLIKATTRPHLNPGLEMLSGIGAYVGEFQTTRGDVLSNQIRFYIGKLVLFTIASLLFAVSLAYALFSRGRKNLIYTTLFLLLACLNFGYYVAWIDAAFTYPFMRLMKVLSLGLVPFVMASGYLESIGKLRALVWNNFLSLAFVLTVCLDFLARSHDTVSFVESYDRALMFAGVYGFAFLVWAGGGRTRHLSPQMLSGGSWFRYDRVSLAVAFVSLGPILCGFKSPIMGEIITPAMRGLMTDVSFLSPFVFSMLVIAMSVLDSIQKTRAMKRKQECDELKLRIVHLMHTVANVKVLIDQIQKEICQMVAANRSTLYIFDKKEQESFLRAEYVYGQVGGNFQVSPQLDATKGIVGYCLEHRIPLKLEDIRRDPRFSGAGAKYPVALSASYRTGSCMIFPLISGGQPMGVLTLADRVKGTFTDEDFTLTLELASMLGILIENSRIRNVAHLTVVATA